jgi:hypothetical protein
MSSVVLACPMRRTLVPFVVALVTLATACGDSHSPTAPPPSWHLSSAADVSPGLEPSMSAQSPLQRTVLVGTTQQFSVLITGGPPSQQPTTGGVPNVPVRFELRESDGDSIAGVLALSGPDGGARADFLMGSVPGTYAVTVTALRPVAGSPIDSSGVKLGPLAPVFSAVGQCRPCRRAECTNTGSSRGS